jgi:antitoxin component YwqK of YwqJK toxin-antitoxin module
MNSLRIFSFYFICTYFWACQSFELEKKVEYYDDGKVSLEYTHINGKKHGEVKRYTNKGTLSSLYMFKDGLQDGKTIHYDYEGNIQEVQYFEKGKKQFSDTIFYKNGLIQSITEFRDDKKNGYLRRYNDSGEVQFEAKYEMDSLIEVNGKSLKS